MDNRPDFWKISIEERTKHDASFMQLGPINGFLTGDKAKEFFIKSSLPTSVLGQIWNLADLNKDGKLDKKEFSIACCMIKKVLTNGQSILPSTLPSTLLIEPTKASPVISTPPNNFNTTPTQSNTPLFNATFPTVQQTPVSMMSPVMSNQSLGLNMSTASPLVNQSTLNSRMQPTSNNLSNLSTNGLSMSMSSLIPTGLPSTFTPSNNNLPNPLAPIPSTSRMKYSQIFQGNDPNSTGYIAGQTAKTLLMQTGLAQGVLAQIWTLADYDKDGKLSLEEFIIAMHLIDFSKAGNTLPSTLPIELQPQRAKTATLPMTSTTSPKLDIFNSSPQAVTSPPQETSAADKKPLQHTFEDKRRENFDRGNAVLEAKRQLLREAEEREKKEREEKERLEAEKRQRIKEEQDRRRQAEIERQMERQRIIDAQREEERRKIFEQREAARNELIKQQRAEWERHKKQELEVQKIKLQEQLSTLKARDKNLEYDMQTLNEKISSYKTKINDTQMNLNELNNKLEETRKNYLLKQSEMEFKQKELSDYQQNLMKFRQEKNFLNEKHNGLNAVTPFGDDHGVGVRELQQKQLTIQQLREEMEKMELQISTTRTQLNSVKTELEVNKNNETNFYQENDRLTKLIDLKRPNGMKQDTSFGMNMSNNSIAAAFKPSLSSSNIRSATPKENYDAFKDEIFKIQQTTGVGNLSTGISNTTSPAQIQDPFANGSDPFGNGQIKSPQSNQGNFSADWANAFEPKHNESNSFGINTDPFGGAITSAQGSAATGNAFNADPFSNQVAGGTAFEDPWANKANSFQSAFMNPDLATSTDFNGFGTDDNWASTAVLNKTSSNTNFSKTKDASPPNVKTNTFENAFAESSNPTNDENNWANFDDEPSVKDTINMFNKPDSAPLFPANNNNNNSQKIPLNSIKFRAEYTFEASREDELSIQIGNIINVDLSIKTDEGWLYGECMGRTGVFPAAFTMRLSDWEAMQQQGATGQFAVGAYPIQTQVYPGQSNTTANTPMSPTGAQIPSSGSFRSSKSFPNQSALNSNLTNTQLSNIKNYYFSIYPYQSTEVGDLVFREFEIINVIESNEDWLTGQIVGSGSGPGNPLRAGIFPSNFVIKFNFPIEYIGKHTIGMATEPYHAKNGNELTLTPAESQLIAIKKISPDGKWSYGESYDINSVLKKGWFPVQSAMPLIDAGATPLYVPSAQATISPNSSKATTPVTNNISGNNKTGPNSMSFNNKSPSISSISSTPPPPSSQVASPTTIPETGNHALSNQTTDAQNNSASNNSNNLPKKTANLDASTPPAALANALAGTSTSSGNLNNNKTKHVSSTPKSNTKQVASNNETSTVPVTASPKPVAEATIPKTAQSTDDASKSENGTNQATNSIKEETKSSKSSESALPSGIIDQVIALYDFQSTTPETIGFPKDAIINVIEKSGDWWLGEYNGKMGLLPYNYVQSIVKTNGDTKFIPDKNYLEKIRTEFKRKNRNSVGSNSATYRNSLQTDEETAHNELEDSSFEEFYDESLSIDNDPLFHDRMQTSSRNTSTDYHNRNEFNNNSHIKRTKSLMPKEELRLNVLNEIVETEKKYVKDLKFIVEYYKNPLKANRLLSRQELEVMFVNIDDIIPINTKFLNSLILRSIEAQQNGEFPYIGDIFIEYLPKMHIYTKFVSGKRFGEDLILEKMKNSTEFSSFINKILNGDAGDFLLKKMLLLPMQRLTQYQLLIEKLIKSLPEADEEYKNLIEASKLTIELIKSINIEVGKIDDLERLEWLEDHVNIKETIGFKFVSQTNLMGPRCIIYYGPLVKEHEFNKGKDLYGFLFNDTFMLIEAHESLHNEIFKAKKLPQLNVYKQPMLLDTINSLQSKFSSQNGSECSFQLASGGKEMSFRTTNPTLKNEWIKQLSKAIEIYKQKKSSIKNSIITSSITQKEPIGRFLLVIMEAQDLIHTDVEIPKAFCEVEMGGKKFYSQKIDSSNPKWNLSMQFSVYDINKDALSVIVYDSRQFSPNVFLGKVEIKMLNIYREQMKENQENGPIPITRCFRMSNVQCGKLMLKMSLSIFN